MIRSLLLILLLLLSLNSKAQNFDINLLKNINPNAYHAQIKYQQFISNATPVVDFSIPVILFATSYIKGDKALRVKSLTIIGSLIIADGTTYIIKNIVKRNRPFVTYPREIIKYSMAGGYSFPSGHTTDAFSLATSLTLNFKQWYVIVPAYLWAGSVGYSRLYLGAHYPSDVFGGAIVGSTSAFITYKLSKWLNKKGRKQ